MDVWQAALTVASVIFVQHACKATQLVPVVLAASLLQVACWHPAPAVQVLRVVTQVWQSAVMAA
jgi:hypothetical protein